jgi:hypothetical protein
MAEEGVGNGSAAPWQTNSEYMWRRVRRSILSGNVVTGFSDGSVKGWLPANKSDYVSEKSGRLSALWHGTSAGTCRLHSVTVPFSADGFGDVGCPGWVGFAGWLRRGGWAGWLPNLPYPPQRTHPSLYIPRTSYSSH